MYDDADLDAYPVPYEDLIMGLNSLDVVELHRRDAAAMQERSSAPVASAAAAER